MTITLNKDLMAVRTEDLSHCIIPAGSSVTSEGVPAGTGNRLVQIDWSGERWYVFGVDLVHRGQIVQDASA
jgi:hypothetical protein